MSGLTDYWENRILDHLFGNVSYCPPAIYVGLSTADPLDDASGLAEPSGHGYARVQTAASDWNAASGSSVDNVNDIAFPEATGSWGTVTHFALFDAADGGNMLAHGALTQSRSVGSSETARFEAGALDVSLD